ncbi:hypothetical protein LCGC14_2905810 [marine sediment metagenome]|uniref:Uncharacterized protein n=1 Tax=marine sediment metagenome TaxID=412755 RepID=A0A0F9A0U3_9ZZZZ
MKRLSGTRMMEMGEALPRNVLYDVEQGSGSMDIAMVQGKVKPPVNTMGEGTDKGLNKTPIVYHIKDIEFCIGGKNKEGNEGPRYLAHRWLWGNVITNKVRGGRTDQKFALC